MKSTRLLLPAGLLSLAICAIIAQPQDLPSSKPLFTYDDSDLSSSTTFVAYGDMRFTNPKETVATNPKVRKWLVDRIAEEKPDAVLLSGDVPWKGGVVADYEQYRIETAPWREARIRVLPALGNHELNGPDKPQCLENWWNAFPTLRGHRWYSARLGSKIQILNLDSNSSLLPESDQRRWIAAQFDGMPESVKFVVLNLHHPPVADVQELADADHNPRPNEISLAEMLKESPLRKRVRFIVCAGHIHNYERFMRDETTYLVSGGAGANPRPVVRKPDDLFQDPAPANYHYVKFVLHGSTLEASMVRVADPSAESPKWETKDTFKVTGL